jgi:hypothetical protein
LLDDLLMSPSEPFVECVPDSYLQHAEFLDDGGMFTPPWFPVYCTPKSDATAIRAIPHAPPTPLEGPAPLPLTVWHQVVVRVNVTWGDVDQADIARIWRNLADPLRASIGSLEQYAKDVHMMNATALAHASLRDLLMRERARSACDVAVERLVDMDAGDRVLLDRIAALSAEDRAYFGRFPLEEEEPVAGVPPFYEMTYGIRRTTESVGEKYRIVAVG